jgi:hypothetical protein
MASLRNTRRRRASAEDIETVFGFARCMVAEQAFIKRKNKGQQGTTFVGYERTFPQRPGLVLLDATADIDGVTELCRWRKHHRTPPERYDSLVITQVPSVATGTVTEWLQDQANRTAYAQHIQSTVLQHVASGQRALIVCKLDMVHAHPPIPGWSEYMELFARKKVTGPATEGDERNGFPWEYQGRSLGLTWWGGYGIGANDWQEADVVLLFDEFHLPGHTLAAMTQGLSSAKASQPPLSAMVSTGTGMSEVQKIKTGHLLRWIRQMALRGKARRFDEMGRCGAQKVVLAGDGLFLMEHASRLFPGATVAYANTGDGSLLRRLMTVLRTVPVADTVKAVEVGKLLGVRWSDVCSKVIKHERFEPLLASLGLKYEPGRGNGGSRFVRVALALEPRPPAATVQAQDQLPGEDCGLLEGSSP